jgi:hypothetical protein
MGTPDREKFIMKLVMAKTVVGTLKIHKEGWVTTTDEDGDDDSNEITFSITDPATPIQQYLELALENEGLQRGLKKKGKKSIRARFYLAGTVVDEKAGDQLLKTTAIKNVDGWEATFATCGKGTVNIIVTVPGERKGDLAKGVIAKKLKALLQEDMVRSKEAAAVAREAGSPSPGLRTHVPFSMADATPYHQPTGASPGMGTFRFGSMGKAVPGTPGTSPRKGVRKGSSEGPKGSPKRAREGSTDSRAPGTGEGPSRPLDFAQMDVQLEDEGL